MTSYGRTALYRAYAKDGTLLYIGISAMPQPRFDQHRNTSPWYGQMASHTLEWFKTRKVAMAAESAAVKAEKPIYNRQLQARNTN